MDPAVSRRVVELRHSKYHSVASMHNAAGLLLEVETCCKIKSVHDELN